MSGENTENPSNPLEHIANELQRSSQTAVANPEEMKRQIENAYKQMKDVDRDQYLRLHNDPAAYEKTNKAFLDRLETFKNSLIAQVDALKNAKEVERKDILSQSKNLPKDIAKTVERHKNFMEAWGKSIDATDPREGATIVDYEGWGDDNKHSPGRYMLAGLLTAYYYADPDNAKKITTETENAYKASDDVSWYDPDEHLSNAAVENIVGAESIAKLRSYPLNSQSIGLLGGYLRIAKETFHNEPTKKGEYEKYLFDKLEQIKTSLEAENHGKEIVYADGSIGKTPLPLIQLEQIMAPREWDEAMKNTPAREQFRILKATVNILSSLHVDLKVNSDLLAFLEKNEEDIVKDDEPTLDKEIRKLQNQLFEFTNKAPQNFEEKITAARTKIQQLQDRNKALGDDKLDSAELEEQLSEDAEQIGQRITELPTLNPKATLDMLKGYLESYVSPIFSGLNSLQASIDDYEKRIFKKEEPLIRKRARESAARAAAAAVASVSGPAGAIVGASTTVAAGAMAGAATETPPTAAGTAPEGIENGDSYGKNWKNGQPKPLPGEWVEYRGKFLTTKDLVLRDDDGKVVGTLKKGTEVTLTNPAAAGLEVQGQHDIGFFVKINYLAGSYWVLADGLEKIKGQEESGEFGVGKVNSEYLPALKDLQEAERLNGGDFMLHFNGKNIKFHVSKTGENNYLVQWNNDKGAMRYRSILDLKKEVNSGRFLQKLTDHQLRNPSYYALWEDWMGEIANDPGFRVEMPDKSGASQVSMVLDWSGSGVGRGNPQLSVKALPHGVIGYAIRRKNVGVDGGNLDSGFVWGFDNLMKELYHLRIWSEEYDEDLKSQEKAALQERGKNWRLINNPYAFYYPSKDKAGNTFDAGRPLTFKQERDKGRVYVVLDWNNNGEWKGNAGMNLWVDKNGMINFAVNYNNGRFITKPKRVGSMEELMANLADLKQKALTQKSTETPETQHEALHTGAGNPSKTVDMTDDPLLAERRQNLRETVQRVEIFKNPDMEKIIGKVIEYKYWKSNNMAKMYLDWGGGNNVKSNLNPIFSVWVDQDAKINYTLFSPELINVGPKKADLITEVIDDVREYREKATKKK